MLGVAYERLFHEHHSHCIHTNQRPRRPRPHHLADPLDVMNRAENVRRVRARHQARPLAQQRPEVLGGKSRAEILFVVVVVDVVGRRSPPPDDQALPLGEVRPWRDVGLVVDGGEDELVADVEVEGGGGVAEELGRGRT